MALDLKPGKFSFVGELPLEMLDADQDFKSEITPEQVAVVDRVGSVMRAYVNAVRELLNGKYAHLKNLAPAHLSDPGNVFAAVCNDGVVVRYEKRRETHNLCVGWMSNDVSETARQLSQEVVRCHKEGERPDQDQNGGITITLQSVNPTTKESKSIHSFRVVVDAVMRCPKTNPKPPQKPYCLLAIENQLEIQIVAAYVGEDENVDEGKQFLARTLLKLPVGWDRLEVYPYLSLECWNPENAPLWAENDILAFVAALQFHESHFHSLDPYASARAEYARQLADFRALLDSEPDHEEQLQAFLRKHPALLCPSHTKMWPKLAIGKNVTDFVFRDASNDYLLVELEKSTHELLRSDGHPRGTLNVARGQITDWKRYIEDNLSTVRNELGLTAITSNPRGLVVIGRSTSLDTNERRKLQAIESEHPKLRIMTYDDVHDSAKAVIENLLGPIVEASSATRIYWLK